MHPRWFFNRFLLDFDGFRCFFCTNKTAVSPPNLGSGYASHPSSPCFLCLGPVGLKKTHLGCSCWRIMAMGFFPSQLKSFFPTNVAQPLAQVTKMGAARQSAQATLNYFRHLGLLLHYWRILEVQGSF